MKMQSSLSYHLSLKKKKYFSTERLDFPGGLVQEMQVQSLDWEDPPEKEMATHSSILLWEIPWTEEPARLESMGLQMSWT